MFSLELRLHENQSHLQQGLGSKYLSRVMNTNTTYKHVMSYTNTYAHILETTGIEHFAEGAQHLAGVQPW